MNTLTQIDRPRLSQPLPPPPVRAGGRGWIAGLLVVLGIGGAIWWGVATYLEMLDRISAFERIPIPSAETVAFDQGTQVLSIEANRLAPIPEVRFRIEDPDGRSVPVRTYEGDLRYDVPDHPGRIGRSVATFDADADGAYAVAVAGPRTSGAVVAVGEDAPRAAVPSIVGALALLIVSGLGAVFLLARRMITGRGGAGR
jgi:hypothetical protein